ncbi:MAG: stage III sporulation protein AE [Clostridiales bacterium]|jgi:stage III sporulation protein AE|nr:stage III sporulation protein AE [Clostridiales bacterium]
MKKLLIFILLFAPLAVNAVAAGAGEEAEQILDRQMRQAEVGVLSEQLERLKNNDFGQIIPDFNIAELSASLTRGEWQWNIPDILRRAFAFFCKELLLSVKVMLSLIALALLCALTENLQSGFSRGGIGGAAFPVCFFLIASVAVKTFTGAVAAAYAAIDGVLMFVTALIPTTLTLLAAGGAVMSAGVFHPVLMLSVQVVTLTVKSVVLPLTLVSAALSVADGLGEREGAGRLASSLGSAVKWIMGVLLTVFVGVVTVQSLAAPALDGLSVKTAKFAVGAVVPVVGSILAESVDLVLGCSVILKNAVGVAGLIAILSLCAAPVLRLAAQAVMFSAASALIAPIADKRAADLLARIGGAVTIVLVMVTVVAFMFIINLAIIIGAGNTAAFF